MPRFNFLNFIFWIVWADMAVCLCWMGPWFFIHRWSAKRTERKHAIHT